MKLKPLVSIAICTFNRAGYLRDTLNDLALQTEDPRRFEILVINNNSTDSTESVCSAFANKRDHLQFKMVTEEKQGLSHARNRAFREAESSLILYIDDDVHLEPDFVKQALHSIHEMPQLKCSGGRIYVSFDDADPDWIPSELMPMFGLHDLGDNIKPYPGSNFPRGGNMIIHKELFEKAGLFDPDLGRTGDRMMGSEEKAFFDKARKEGYTPWYLPGITLWHRIGKNRLQKKYLKEQSVGIGRSEYLRLKSSKIKLTGKLFSEFVKLGGSILLAFGYLINGKTKASRFILIFRMWVLKGFLSR